MIRIHAVRRAFSLRHNRAAADGGALDGASEVRTESGGRRARLERQVSFSCRSLYGASFLSNTWYQTRLDNTRLGFTQGSILLGFDLVSSLGAESRPDIKKHVLRRK